MDWTIVLRSRAALFVVAFAVCATVANATPATTYTFPTGLHWVAVTPKGGSSSYHYAMIRGKYADACDNIVRHKFPGAFVYPWHSNDDIYSIYTVLQGTLVIGFDKNHAKWGDVCCRRGP
jgi:hypothetical protein